MRLQDLFETRKAVAEATGDKPFDNMMKGIVKGTKKQAAADRREQKKQDQERARAAFGPNPADKLSIRKPGVAEGEGSKSSPYEQGGTDAWYHRGFDPEAHGYRPGTEEYREYKRGFDQNDFGPEGGKQY